MTLAALVALLLGFSGPRAMADDDAEGQAEPAKHETPMEMREGMRKWLAAFGRRLDGQPRRSASPSMKPAVGEALRSGKKGEPTLFCRRSDWFFDSRRRIQL